MVVIQCSATREAGKQYTKRLLPDFLIPYSPIRMDRVLEAEHARRVDGAPLEDCSLIMGCLELRTVRKHLKNLQKVSEEAALEISRELSHVPQYARLPETDPEQNSVMRLYTLYKILLQAAAAAGHHVAGQRQILLAQWWKCVGRLSTSCVSRVTHPP